MTTPRLLDVLHELADADPDAVALIDARAGKQSAGRVSRRQLLAQAGVLSAELRRRGVDAGDCIGVWLPNWSHAVVAQLAALSVGAHLIGLNTRYNSDEVGHVLQTARPRVLLIAHDFNGLDLLGPLRTVLEHDPTATPQLLVVPAPGHSLPADLSDYELGDGIVVGPLPTSDNVDAKNNDAESIRPHPKDNLATAFTTSGSTGWPKLAAHLESAVVEHALAVGRRLGLTANDVILGALPLSGAFGFATAMPALLAGSPIVLEPVFDADGVLLDMAEFGVSHIVGADDLIGRLATAWRSEPRPLSLRWLGIADFEGHSKELAAWAEEELGAITAGVYGSSELFALTSFWPSDYPTEQRWNGGGRVVMDSVEVRVADPETDAVVPDGEQGELQFRGPNVADAYLGAPELRAQMFTEDGWFHTGDLGLLVAPGTFQYVCRQGDGLRLRGFLVDPAEIEVRIGAHPGVALVKVVGVPGADGATCAVAFAVAKDGAHPTEAELIAWSAETLAKFKVPSEVHILDHMPTTSGVNGTKIRTAELRAMAIKGRSPL
jgi:fatty-acyl-CoA synthase